MNEILKVLDNPQNHFKTWPEALAALCHWCEEYDVSLSLAYDPGWFVRMGSGTTGEPEFDEATRGYTIMVGMTSFVSKDGTDVLYANLAHAVHDGLRLLRSVLEERGGNDDASR